MRFIKINCFCRLLYSILNANVNVHNIQSQMILYESKLDAKTRKLILLNERLESTISFLQMKILKNKQQLKIFKKMHECYLALE